MSCRDCPWSERLELVASLAVVAAAYSRLLYPPNARFCWCSTTALAAAAAVDVTSYAASLLKGSCGGPVHLHREALAWWIAHQSMRFLLQNERELQQLLSKQPSKYYSKLKSAGAEVEVHRACKGKQRGVRLYGATHTFARSPKHLLQNFLSPGDDRCMRSV
jgi:hypothetical protein